MIDKLRADLAERLAAGLGTTSGGISLGVFSSTGRQFGIVVEQTATDRLRLSDGGDAWSDLWMGGLVGGAPTRAEREHIDALCSLYKISWDSKFCELVAVSHPTEAADTCLRIFCAAIALDGWRALAGRRHEIKAPPRRLLKATAELAIDRGLQLDTKQTDVRGRTRIWHASAIAKRRAQLFGEPAAAITFLLQDERESTCERAFGWAVDTELPLVLVVRDEFVDEVKDSLVERVKPIEVAGRQASEKRLVELTEKVIASAA